MIIFSLIKNNKNNDILNIIKIFFMSLNFEELYNKLKEEYESSKKYNDELCKEYESTIEMLSDSVESFKKEKEILELKLLKLEQDQKNFKKEKESLINKNKDKIVDIQNLNKQNDRLSNEVKKLKEEKLLFDSKIVTLENDNEHFQNKIREYEALAEDLENQLESALEENITLQTEFETFKQTTGDQLIRKDEEIRDIKTDLINKDKYIQKIQRGNNSLIVKNIKKNFIETGNIQERRRYTLLPGTGVGGNNSLLAFQQSLIAKGLSGNIEKNYEKKHSTNIKLREAKNIKIENDINNRFRARRSLYTPGFGVLAKLFKEKEEINKGLGDNGIEKKENKLPSGNDNGKKENKFTSIAREKSNKSLISNNSSIFTNKNLADEKIDEKSEKSEISGIEKEFTDLKICREKGFDYIGNDNIKNISNGDIQLKILGKEKIILDNMGKILERIKKRKDKLNDIKRNKRRIKKLKEN